MATTTPKANGAAANNVPLRNKGSGTKKLIGAAMQMKLHGGKNISLIDEIEVGLDPPARENFKPFGCV